MPKLEDIDPTLDPIVRAALIDDEPEDDETSDDKSSQVADQDTTDESGDDADVEEKPEEGNEVADESSTEKEALDDEETDTVEDEPDKKPTRKEKREAKRQRYLESIRKDGEHNSSSRSELFATDPNYKPVDYSSIDELDVDTLQHDREQYGRNNFSKGAELERARAEQDKFWQGAEYEDKLLQTDPKYAFLNEKSKKYDADKTEELHELFLELVGFDPQTKFARRTDISYGNFVKAEVKRMERWASSNEDEIIKNATTQRATAGIRPSGSAERGLGKLKPGDIARMSQAEFEKHEAEIDRQIMAELGQ